MTSRKKVFISYAHKDREWLDRLLKQLIPLERRKLIKLFHDSLIEWGSEWAQKIDDAIADHDIAILLISADYLASEYIDTKELPSILNTADSKHVIAIFVGQCHVEHISDLKKIQAANPPDEPLSRLDEDSRDEFFVGVAKKVYTIVAPPVDPDSDDVPEPAPTPAGSSSERPKLKTLWIRRRRSVITCLAGLLAGLALGWILATAGREAPNPAPELVQREALNVASDEPVFMIGGGTVDSYLKSLDPSTFDNPGNNKEINVLLLQGPTDAAEKLFGHIYEEVPVLVMASKKLTIKGLRRTDPKRVKEKSRRDEVKEPEDKPPAAFAVYLGEDRLQMLLAPGSNQAKKTESDNAIRDILRMRSGVKGDELDFAELRKRPNWVAKFKVYAGAPGSGTNSHWQKRLAGAWPSKFTKLDIQNPGSINDDFDEPKVYLGSEALIKLIKPSLKSDPVVIPMNEGGQPATRGLYLYGALDDSGSNKVVHDNGEPGFYLYKDERMTKLLKYLLNALLKKELLNPDCFKSQWDYFHLDANVGWVKDVNPEGRIYEAPCEAKPPG